MTSLRYDRPASRWFEALPIGNGRLGGMVFGGVGTEFVRLSESTAWSGAPSDHDVNPGAAGSIPVIRRLLFQGSHAEAQRLAAEHLTGRPTSFGTNLPLPRLRLDFPSSDFDHYRRSLDLDTGIARVDFDQDQAHFVRETFASHPDGVIAMRLAASRPGLISFVATLDDTVLPGEVTSTPDGLMFSGRAVETLHSDGSQGVGVEIGVRFVVSGGMVDRQAGAVAVTGADSVIVYVVVGTSWSSAFRTFPDISYDEVRAAHVEDHQRLMRRVSLDLGPSPDLPTDVRRERLARGERDDDLIALYFQYGRYLTIAGSREDSPLPLALQGVWNDGLASGMGWSNDFHLAINTQQNYWAAESTNLAECHAPLFRFLTDLAQSGRSTARQMYGADGWVAHTVTNAWGYTAPGRGIGWGLNVTGGAWLALQLWEHYEYQQDALFLREQAYPVLRPAALFFLDYLTPEPSHGWLVAGPSESPENSYLAADGTPCSIAMGTTADRVFAEAILRICGEAAAILDVDPALRPRIAAARDRLSPFRVGRHGQLQEWLDDVEEADPAHRHTSHLCAVFPERQISPRRTPSLAAAAAVTLERRKAAPGWEQTEWAEANFAAFYARLLDGDKALHHVTRLIADASEANLLSFSQGGIAGAEQNIYSFDGNAGGTGAIAEMLLQSTAPDGSDGSGEIELLPALPSTWLNGSVRGLRARGGFTVDLSWRDGVLHEARIEADRPARTRLRYRDTISETTITPDHPFTLVNVASDQYARR